MDEKREMTLNIEELEEHIALSAPDSITVVLVEGAVFNDGSPTNEAPPPEVYVNGSGDAPPTP